jgi:hypothetical protein
MRRSVFVGVVGVSHKLQWTCILASPCCAKRIVFMLGFESTIRGHKRRQQADSAATRDPRFPHNAVGGIHACRERWRTSLLLLCRSYAGLRFAPTWVRLRAMMMSVLLRFSMWLTLGR